MKSILLSTLAIVLLLNVNAQNIPNPNFEEWTPSGSEPPFDWEEPTNWKSNNATVEFVGAVVTQTDDSFEGDAAVKIRTMSIFGETVPGLLVNGNPSVDFANYSVNFDEAGTPLSDITDLTNSVPIYLNGYYKYNTNTDDDFAYAIVMITKFNTATNQHDTTAFGSVELEQVNKYTSFSINIEDLGSEIDPDNIIVVFYSTNPESPMEEGELFIDELHFVFLPSDISENLEKMTVSIFPNPVSDKLQLSFESLKTNNTIKVYSVFGQEIISIESTQKVEPIDFTNLKNGVYIVKVFDKFQRLMKTERVIKI